MKKQHLSQSRQSKIIALQTDERGLSTVEYVIILVLIAVTGITIWSKFGKTIVDKITDSESQVKDRVVY